VDLTAQRQGPKLLLSKGLLFTLSTPPSTLRLNLAGRRLLSSKKASWERGGKRLFQLWLSRGQAIFPLVVR
jgi:hypothetical protein